MKSKIIIDKKKNKVTKICRNKAEFDKEIYIYEKNLSFVPRLFMHNCKNTIVLDYINSKPIIDIDKPDFAAISLLFVYLHSLEIQNGKVICLMDSNPKNFLFSLDEQKYYMIDFSEWEYNFPEIDLIHFLLFWASILPYKQFYKASQNFINHYKKYLEIDIERWNNNLPKVIQMFDERRKKYNKSEKTLCDSYLQNRNSLVLTED